ncbi:MAG: Gfo/Idh/MocA family oxidoreductase [Pseudomonadota bacterium]
MDSGLIKLGIVGVGKIVRDQHLPAISKNADFELVAAASRNATIEGVQNFRTIQEMLDNGPKLDAVALCMPPQYRYQAARYALSKGVHVLLEKPPGATVSEVVQLADLAKQNSLSLFATWHSRCGAAVNKAKQLLAGKSIESASVVWREDVRKWHPDQEWIWQAGGLGVFDPGINGLSILTYLLPEPAFVTHSSLSFPANKAAPIAASMRFTTSSGLPIDLEFDWRQSGGEVWDIHFQTDEGELLISEGGGSVSLSGNRIEVEESNEYEVIYQRFAEIIRAGESDVDLAPLALTADAFLLGDREIVDAF